MENFRKTISQKFWVESPVLGNNSIFYQARLTVHITQKHFLKSVSFLQTGEGFKTFIHIAGFYLVKRLIILTA